MYRVVRFNHNETVIQNFKKNNDISMKFKTKNHLWNTMTSFKLREMHISSVSEMVCNISYIEKFRMSVWTVMFECG